MPSYIPKHCQPAAVHAYTLGFRVEGPIGVILGSYWDNGKENGSYYIRMETLKFQCSACSAEQSLRWRGATPKACAWAFGRGNLSDERKKLLLWAQLNYRIFSIGGIVSREGDMQVTLNSKLQVATFKAFGKSQVVSPVPEIKEAG